MGSDTLNTAFLDMIQGEKPLFTPVWYMRQAGRSQKKYREIKKQYSLFEITRNPELCAYVTQLPVEEYHVDAAILYKDIMSPMAAIGVDVALKSGVGPVVAQPIRNDGDVNRIRPFDDTKVDYIAKTIELLRNEILQVPLIGFAGAPFTIASYLVEGGPTKNYNKTRGLLLGNKETWHKLMRALTDMTIAYITMQINAGVQAIQIFDSWVGALSVAEYTAGVLPYMDEIIHTIKINYPMIPISMNGLGASHLIHVWNTLELDMLSLDWRYDIRFLHIHGIHKPVQGNLDPAYLYADTDVIAKEVDRILAEGVSHGRHVFNLGHGVFPEVDPEKLVWLTAYVHERSAALREVRT